MTKMMQINRPRTNMFAEEPRVRLSRSQFDRSHMLKMGFDASYLYPILVDEVLPGDTFTCKLNGFCRITHPLDAPLMDNIELETFFFFVPNRLLWTNWEAFMGAHDAAGAQDTDYTIPVLATGTVSHDAGSYTYAKLAAAMGLPHGLNFASTECSALPFRAYALIWNEWFRDQNIMDETAVGSGNGPDDSGAYQLLKSSKKHDYFTSALPYLQKGDAVDLFGNIDNLLLKTDAVEANEVTVESGSGTRRLTADTTTVEVDTLSTGDELYIDPSDLALSINSLRQSVAIQRLLERDARGGTRYTEIIKSHFGVTSPDFRLQRPEFLGGGKAFININPVAVSAYTATDPTGKVKAYGTGIIRGHGWAKSFTEHGYVLGIIRARGDITYFQGQDRLWARSTRYDFYIPALANLGEQSILNKELFVKNDGATTDELAFGYQERWAEYRYRPSRIVGVLNPDATSALSFWHLAEDFSDTPSLNQTFMWDNTPMDRVTTTDTGDQFLLDLWFDYKCARPIPVHSIPSLLGERF